MTAELNPPVEIKVLDARLHEWGLPAYQSEMAAAIDLHACRMHRSRSKPARLPCWYRLASPCTWAILHGCHHRAALGSGP